MQADKKRSKKMNGKEKATGRKALPHVIGIRKRVEIGWVLEQQNEKWPRNTLMPKRSTINMKREREQ